MPLPFRTTEWFFLIGQRDEYLCALLSLPELVSLAYCGNTLEQRLQRNEEYSYHDFFV